jgi:dynein heavy chain
MTGVLQSHARKYAIPIDTLSFGFRVTTAAGAEAFAGPSPAEPAPEDGILVSGLWIDGARWAATEAGPSSNGEEAGSRGYLQESEPGIMYAPLPVVHFRPTQVRAPVPEWAGLGLQGGRRQ